MNLYQPNDVVYANRTLINKEYGCGSYIETHGTV